MFIMQPIGFQEVADAKKIFGQMDEWIRHRLRMCDFLYQHNKQIFNR